MLETRGLSVWYQSAQARSRQRALYEVDFQVPKGGIVALIGESGCGKSTLGRALVGAISSRTGESKGEVLLDGEDLLELPKRRLQSLWGSTLAYLPQDVAGALNPSRRIGPQLEEPLRIHGSQDSASRRVTMRGMLQRLGLGAVPGLLRRYPRQLSGGQQQRVAIGIALMGQPRYLVLDEPTNGVDASNRRGITTLIKDVSEELGTSVVYITHDLLEAAEAARSVAVMYAGRIVEQGPIHEVWHAPSHPYTMALKESLPTLQRETFPRGMGGSVASPDSWDYGCAFRERCPGRDDKCAGPITLRTVRSEWKARCVRPRLVEPPLSGPPLTSDNGGTRNSRTLSVMDLTVTYSRAGAPPLTAVDDLSLHVDQSEVLGIIGESGSGKSSVLRAIAGLVTPSAGSLHFGGYALQPRARERSKDHLRSIQIIFQSPSRSLNPRQSVGYILAAPLRIYEPEMRPGDMRVRVEEALAEVALPAKYTTRRPWELSGGEQQRVAIARALIANPVVLLCDEIVSALDVSVQAGLLELIRKSAMSRRTAVIFVTHDLAVARLICDRIIVLRGGRIVEAAATQKFFASPSSSYGQLLVEASGGSAPQ